MESFFRRMSSIVRRNSNKSPDIDEHNGEDAEQQEYFRQMRERRLSAPDIRRRSHAVDRVLMESDQKIALFQQTSLQKLTPQTSIGLPTGKQNRSKGMLFLFNSMK
ncbi:unnamed protein product [Rotaria socialis]|uniref:Uncharacterized protein n=1 Tax=Rotaria socialis TaxID=392032 RepID=A0A820YMM0_9BILA|nr:unnamed protein product [Rotaria socialis]CAF4551429.1 unnamed protein product [Rotaria socialis]